MILKKTNLFLLLLLSNSFAFSGETAKAMEEESDDENLAELLQPVARYTAGAASKPIDDGSDDDFCGELIASFRGSCSLGLPGSDADKERISSIESRASTSLSYEKSLHKKEMGILDDALRESASCAGKHTPRPERISGQKRGLTPHQEGDETSDSSAPSSVQSSPQRPKPVKGIVTTAQKRRRLNFTKPDNNNDQDMATS